MDLIDTAADVIRERNQLKERVRELEKELAELKTLMRDYIQNDIGPRVKLTKAILELDETNGLARCALEALEGK